MQDGDGRDPLRKPSKRHQWLIDVAHFTQTDDCIEWPFKPTETGYGRVCINYKQTMATHVVLELTGRPRPQVDSYHGAVAIHACDNPPCCNPRHLRWATQQDNIADMASKGRKARGEASGQAKLTASDIPEIREYALRGWSHRQLGRQYGVSSVAIGNILRGKTWTHIH